MNARDIRRQRLRDKLTMALDPQSEFVITPCIAVCQMDPVSQLCEGCFRDIQEIARWGSLANAQKREVWRQIDQRMNTLNF
jgi:uncharacterized protein